MSKSGESRKGEQPSATDKSRRAPKGHSKKNDATDQLVARAAQGLIGFERRKRRRRWAARLVLLLLIVGAVVALGSWGRQLSQQEQWGKWRHVWDALPVWRQDEAP